MLTVDSLREYLKHDPDNSVLALQLIEGLASLGNTAEALEVAKRSKALNPNDPHIVSWCGHLGIAQRDFQLAIECYELLLEGGYKESGIKINCALAYYQSGRYQQAKDLLESAGELVGEHRLLRARCYAHLEDLTPAMVDLTALLQDVADENKAETLGLLSLLLLDDGQYEKAHTQAEEALAIDDRQFDARLVEASLALYKQDVTKAYRDLESLDEEFPNSGRIIAMKALCLMYRLEFEQAVDALDQACHLMPNHVGSRVNLGWCHFSMADLDKANDCFIEATKIDRTFAESYGGLALVNAYQEKWKDCQENYQRALKLDPASPSALFAMAVYLKHRGKTHKADSIVAGLMNHKGELSEMSLREVVSSMLVKKTR